MNEPHKLFVAAKAFIVEGDTFLVTKEHKEIWTGWSIPGGRIDKGEHPHETLQREVMEEIGVRLASISEMPIHIQSTVTTRGNGLIVLYYQAELASKDYTFSTEVSEANFVTKADFEALPFSLIHKPAVVKLVETL